MPSGPWPGRPWPRAGAGPASHPRRRAAPLVARFPSSPDLLGCSRAVVVARSWPPPVRPVEEGIAAHHAEQELAQVEAAAREALAHARDVALGLAIALAVAGGEAIPLAGQGLRGPPPAGPPAGQRGGPRGGLGGGGDGPLSARGRRRGPGGPG